MPGITAEALYGPHGSIPRNPLIAQAAYYVHAIERWGTGTTKMVEQCEARSLPPPEFTDAGYAFSAVLRRTALSQKALEAHGLNARQIKAVLTVGIHGELTGALYRKLTSVSDTTSARDIQDLERWGVVQRIGSGRDTRYRVRMRLKPRAIERVS
jgi:ATP-dependent DNA helicase RecG